MIIEKKLPRESPVLVHSWTNGQLIWLLKNLTSSISNTINENLLLNICCPEQKILSSCPVFGNSFTIAEHICNLIKLNATPMANPSISPNNWFQDLSTQLMAVEFWANVVQNKFYQGIPLFWYVDARLENQSVSSYYWIHPHWPTFLSFQSNHFNVYQLKW